MTQRRRYCSDKEGARLAELARAMGVARVAGVEFFPDGRVRILDDTAAPTPRVSDAAPENPLDAWENGFVPPGRA